MKPLHLVVAGAVVLSALTACGDDSADDAGQRPTPSAAATTAAISPPTTVAVRAGVNDPSDLTIAALAYLPAQVSIAAGTTVAWTIAGPEPHSVTFFPPGQTPPPPDKAGPLFAPSAPQQPWDGTTLANSGLGPQGPGGPLTFELTFAKQGTFGYVCVIHPRMQGKVVVGDAASAEAQDAIDARGSSEEQQWLAEGRAAKKTLVETAPKQVKGADGSTTWTVEMGVATPHTDVLAFTDAGLDVAAGDRVTFVNNTSVPHTATFAGGTQVPPNPGDPKILAPAPGASPQRLKGTGYFNTGWLPPDAPPGAGPPLPARSFTFAVPGSGSYSYVCALHVPSGMVGTITAS